MTQLEELYASGNLIEWLPKEIENLENLRILDIDFGFELARRVVQGIFSFESQTHLLSACGIAISNYFDGLSYIPFLNTAIQRLLEITHFCKEPKSPTVLLVQPKALKQCLKKAIELGYPQKQESD
jgi:Leucine-rich repeat (LRR) protein